MRTIIDCPIAHALLNREVTDCIFLREEKSPDPIADPAAGLDRCTSITAGRGVVRAGHGESAMPYGSQRHSSDGPCQDGLLRSRQGRFRPESALQARHGLFRDGGGAARSEC